MSNIREKAIELANQPYAMLVFLDETTDGTLGYVALNPELEGCVSQGDTSDEAVKNLHAARIDFIESMLEDGLSIPEPKPMAASVHIPILDFLSYGSAEIDDIPYDEASDNFLHDPIVVNR